MMLNPIISFPECSIVSFLEKIKLNPPRAKRGNINVSTFSLKPMSATSQPVMVVPRLAPSIIPIPLLKPRMPAPASDITSSITSELLCNTAVTIVPETMALRVVSVFFRKNNLKERPARFLIDSSNIFMPNKNKPKPANNGHICIWPECKISSVVNSICISEINLRCPLHEAQKGLPKVNHSG